MTPANENAIRAACRRCTEEIQQAMRKPVMVGLSVQFTKRKMAPSASGCETLAVQHEQSITS